MRKVKAQWSNATKKKETVIAQIRATRADRTNAMVIIMQCQCGTVNRVCLRYGTVCGYNNKFEVRHKHTQRRKSVTFAYISSILMPQYFSKKKGIKRGG